MILRYRVAVRRYCPAAMSHMPKVVNARSQVYKTRLLVSRLFHCTPRMYSTESDTTSGNNAIFVTDTDPATFADASEEFLSGIADTLETEESDPLDMIDDIEWSDGILRIVVPSVGTWVLNKHSFTKQIWVSSPLSGPSKYNFHEEEGGLWLSEKGKFPLAELLSNEFSGSLKATISF